MGLTQLQRHGTLFESSSSYPNLKQASTGGPVNPDQESSARSTAPLPAGDYQPHSQSTFQPVLPPQPRKRHTLRNVILIVLAVIILGVIGLTALGSYLLHRQQEAKTAAAVALDQANVAPPAASSGPDIGIPVYPGATLSSAGAQIVTTPKGTSINAAYTTPDSPTQVTQFYQQQLGSNVSVTSVGPMTLMSVGDPGNSTTVVIDIQNGQTLMRITHSKSN
jgi:hypothetical protein